MPYHERVYRLLGASGSRGGDAHIAIGHIDVVIFLRDPFGYTSSQTRFLDFDAFM